MSYLGFRCFSQPQPSQKSGAYGIPTSDSTVTISSHTKDEYTKSSSSGALDSTPCPRAPEAARRHAWVAGVPQSQTAYKSLSRAQRRVYKSIMFALEQAHATGLKEARLGHECMRFYVTNGDRAPGRISLVELGGYYFDNNHKHYKDLLKAYQAAWIAASERGIITQLAFVDDWLWRQHRTSGGSHSYYSYTPRVLVIPLQDGRSA